MVFELTTDGRFTGHSKCNITTIWAYKDCEIRTRDFQDFKETHRYQRADREALSDPSLDRSQTPFRMLWHPCCQHP